MADSDSEGIDNLLGDIDDLDEELFGKKKKPAAKKKLSNLDDLFSKNKEPARPKRNLNDILSSATKKTAAVSFLDQQKPAAAKRKDEGRKGTSEGVSYSGDEATSMNLLTDSESRRPIASVRSTVVDPPTSIASSKPSSNVDDLFGPLQRRTAMPRARTTPNLQDASMNQTPSHMEPRQSTQPSGDLPFLMSDPPGGSNLKAAPSAGQMSAGVDGAFHGYDRVQRFENEIDRLNREIDDLKRKKKEDEEEIINEWKEKLSRKQREHEQAINELEANHRKTLDRLNEEFAGSSERLTQNLQRQIEAMGVVHGESRKQEVLLEEVDKMTEQIKQIANQVSAIKETSTADRQATASMREEQLTHREIRLENEETRLREERKAVDALNMKLQSMYDRSEEEVLKEKWHIRDERNRLNTEKIGFKEDQKYILEVIEKQKAETDAARTSFLNEQHDLLVRMLAEKAAFDEEKRSFITQRDNDIARLKAEAQALEEKMKQVGGAERLMTTSRQAYQSKYRELADLEQTLVDECVELQQCRAELEASFTNRAPRINQEVNRSSFFNNID